MRISDWSSDVCSSDLAMIDVRDDGDVAERHRGVLSKTGLEKLRAHSTLAALQQEGTAFSDSCATCRNDRRVRLKIEGASWRERLREQVEVSGVSVTSKKKTLLTPNERLT